MSILSLTDIAYPPKVNVGFAYPANGNPVSTPFFNILLFGPQNPVPPKFICITSPPTPEQPNIVEENTFALSTGYEPEVNDCVTLLKVTLVTLLVVLVFWIVNNQIGEGVGVFVGVLVAVLVGVTAGVPVGVDVGVFVGVSLGVFVGVGVGETGTTIIFLVTYVPPLKNVT